MVPWVELQPSLLFYTGCGFSFIRRVQPKQTRLNVIYTSVYVFRKTGFSLQVSVTYKIHMKQNYMFCKLHLIVRSSLLCIKFRQRQPTNVYFSDLINQCFKPLPCKNMNKLELLENKLLNKTIRAQCSRNNSLGIVWFLAHFVTA